MLKSILGLDVGDVRIGVAKGLPQHNMALPKCVLTRKGREADLKALADMALEEEAQLWVVGLPRQADDSLGDSALKIMSFAKRLSHASKLPVVFVDEWESTVEAQAFLLNADVSRKKRKQSVDKLAATVILNRYFAHGPLDIKLT